MLIIREQLKRTARADHKAILRGSIADMVELRGLNYILLPRRIVKCWRIMCSNRDDCNLTEIIVYVHVDQRVTLP